jgi:Wiskott-Aldrich syndrome protein
MSASGSNINEPSTLLSDEENQIIFTVIGQRRVTKATAVAQMFHATPNPASWTKFRTGVVCFVKDNTLKSYFIRMIDISVSY